MYYSCTKHCVSFKPNIILYKGSGWKDVHVFNIEQDQPHVKSTIYVKLRRNKDKGALIYIRKHLRHQSHLCNVKIETDYDNLELILTGASKEDIETVMTGIARGMGKGHGGFDWDYEVREDVLDFETELRRLESELSKKEDKIEYIRKKVLKAEKSWKKRNKFLEKRTKTLQFQNMRDLEAIKNDREIIKSLQDTNMELHEKSEEPLFKMIGKRFSKLLGNS